MTSALKLCQILRSESVALHEPGTGQIIQVLRASLRVRTYAMKYGRISKLLFHFFRQRDFPVTVLNCARVLQFVLDNNQAKAHILTK